MNQARLKRTFFSGLKRMEQGSRVPGGASVLLEDTFRADLLDWLGLFTACFDVRQAQFAFATEETL
jgi:hypothetical protein